MIEILVVLIALTLVGFWLIKSCSTEAEIIGFLLCVMGVLGMLIYLLHAFSWFAAEHKAQIINREHGAEYTQEEVFWASDVIDVIHEIKRKRVELNGDLMTGRGE